MTGIVDHSDRLLTGRTRDISETGLSVILPTIRVGERDLSEPGTPLRVLLLLPQQTVIMHATLVRCSPFGPRLGQGYLLGVHITHMSERDRTDYLAYLRSLG